MRRRGSHKVRGRGREERMLGGVKMVGGKSRWSVGGRELRQARGGEAAAARRRLT